MEHVYILEHVYEVDDSEEVKFIGAFSSEEFVQKAIDDLMTKSGFINFDRACFSVSKIKINDYSWKEGFISWEEAE